MIHISFIFHSCFIHFCSSLFLSNSLLYRGATANGLPNPTLPAEPTISHLPTRAGAAKISPPYAGSASDPHPPHTPSFGFELCNRDFQVGIVEMENDGTGCVVVQLPPLKVVDANCIKRVTILQLHSFQTATSQDSRCYGLQSQSWGSGKLRSWAKACKLECLCSSYLPRTSSTPHQSSTLGFCLDSVANLGGSNKCLHVSVKSATNHKTVPQPARDMEPT